MASYKTEGSLHPWAWAGKAGISWSRELGWEGGKDIKDLDLETRTQTRIESLVGSRGSVYFDSLAE